MTDTFISYSRKDIAFAKIIHESLSNNNLETWIDWQDIPPGVDWFAEIQEAIEQADTFIFIISPTSVKSEICSKEIAHAEKNNKRLIPIVIGDVDTHDVPATLQPLNWIFFKDEDQRYVKAISDLMTALTLDQPWLKAHTRNQNRALEWERSGGENGYLLHGADLKDAEHWLGQATGKDPAPTTLQTQYILASRAQTTQRQRRTTAAVAVGLVIAIMLGVLAWKQRNVAVSESHMRATAQNEAVAEANMRATAQSEAELAKVEAEQQRDIALSRYYADKSSEQLEENNWELALLLAIESGRRSESYEAMSALRAAFAAPSRTLLLLEEHEKSIESLDWSPNKTLIATAGYDDLSIRIWDAVSGDLLNLIESPQIWKVIWHPDGSRILGLGDSGFGVWDVSTGRLLFWIQEEGEDQTVKAVWNKDGSTVLSYIKSWDDDFQGYYPTRYAVYDGLSGNILLSSQEDLNQCLNSDFISHDKSRFVLWKRIKERHEDPSTKFDIFEGQVTDWETGKVLWSFPELSGESEILWSADDSKIVLHHYNDFIQVWETNSGDLLLDIPVENSVYFVTLDPSGNRLLFTRCDFKTRNTCTEANVHIWDIKLQAEVLVLTGFTREITSISWSPDGKRIITNTYDPSNTNSFGQIWDAGNGMEIVHFWGVGSKLQWSEKSTSILSTSGLRDAETGDLIAPFPDIYSSQMIWDQTEDKVLILADHTARVLSTRPGAEMLAIPAHQFGAYQAVWDRTNQFILTSGCDGVDDRYICNQGSLKIWDAVTGELIREFYGHTGQVGLAGWNQTGSQVYSGSSDKTVRVWDVQSGDELFTLPHSATGIAGVAWNPDESKILTFISDGYMRDNNAYIWDASSGELLLKISPVESRTTDQLRNAVWSLDGSKVLTYTCEDTTQESSGCRVQIWDAESGIELQRLINPEGRSGGAFLLSPDGNLVLAGNTDASMVWNAEDGELRWSEQIKFSEAAWSPENTWIAAADPEFSVRIYDSQTGQEMKKLLGHTDRIQQLIWSYDNTTLLTRSMDNTIRLWDSSTGTLLTRITVNTDYLLNAQWSWDESYILTPGKDGYVRIWYTHMEDLLTAACAIAPRNMSEQEWQAYFGEEPFHKTCP